MYQIEIKDNSKEKVFVFCPSAISVKEWIYTQLLNAMHEDLKYHTTLATHAVGNYLRERSEDFNSVCY